MTSFDDMDRRLTARLDERAAPRAPQGLSEAVTQRVNARRQRPAWATTERWISMETRAQFGAVPRAVIVLATLALLTALAAGAIAVGASIAPKLPDPFGVAGNGLIAFVSDGDIYTVEPDGSDLQQITSGPELESGLSWSRDGTRLAYWSGPEDGPGTLFVSDAQGNDRVELAQSLGSEYGAPVWSEDGTEVMYEDEIPEVVEPCPVIEGGDCGSRLFVAKADGTGSMQVGDSDLDARGPTLAPDGWTVAFGGGEAASEALYLMNWDGSEVRRVETGIPGNTWAFAQQSWSGDGNHLVTHDGNGFQSIWLVALDGSGANGPAEKLSAGWWPTFAPDGSAIDWTTDRAGVIYTLDTASMDLAFGVGEMIWSPDATGFAGVLNGQLVFLDRNGEVLLDQIAPADEDNPSWQRLAP